MPNNAVQADNLRAVCLVVSLSFHCTTRQTAHKFRLTAALTLIEEHEVLDICSIEIVQLL